MIQAERTVSNAKVEVRQLETGATRTLTTSGDGLFNAPSVPVGHYTVRVTIDGFDPQQQAGIELTLGQSLQLILFSASPSSATGKWKSTASDER